MAVARGIKDTAFVAQSCYSLGNTFTLMRNYIKAIEYHNIHLQYAQQLEDRFVERVCICVAFSVKLYLYLCVYIDTVCVQGPYLLASN